MRSLLLSGLALALASTSGAAIARDSGPRTGGLHTMPRMNMPHRPTHTSMPRHNWGGQHQGRWVGGWRAPGGWNAYHRPSRGYVLPSYWAQPSFYIGNYSTYGFSQPQAGYGWSRYYNDAVLTDRNGRVYDSVPNYNWDRDDNGSDYQGDDYSDSYGYDERAYRDDRGDRNDRRYRSKDRDGGLGGALVGGVVGGVAGNIIGGRGSRTVGTLIGAGVGALAGMAIDVGDRAGRGPSGQDRYRTSSNDRQIDYGYDYDQPDDAVTYQGQWNGTWTGNYNGGPTQVYSGTYGGRYEGQGPHWDRRDQAHGDMRHQSDNGQIIRHSGQGYGHGYRYGAPAVTTIIIQSAPVVTTTTTTTEYVTEYVNVRKRVAYKAPAKKVWKPKPRCVCR